jgi:hypothetical protein
MLMCSDEYTYFVAEEPKVAEAGVRLRGPLDGGVVAEGTTGDDGELLLTGIREGDYIVDVSGPRHRPFRGSVRVVPGIETELGAFMTRQTVSYRWSVVPVTRAPTPSP